MTTPLPRESGSFRWNPSPAAPEESDPSQLMCAFGQDAAVPTITIAIPTFRRETLLVETIRTVLDQTKLAGVELLVVDNDPDSTCHEHVLAMEPRLRDMAFRYYRNPANLGMFGNWNRCLALARAPLISILNDDDLLHPGFLATVLPVIRDHPQVEAAACSKRELDFRDGPPRLLQARPLTRVVHALLRFGLSGRRSVRPRHLFFTNVVGNSLGIIFRTITARELGGFIPDDYPTADYFFFARLMRRGRFIQLARIRAYIRIAENESANPETIIGFLRQRLSLQRALLADRAVPQWWSRLIPASARFDLDHHRRLWRAELDTDAISRRLDIALPTRGRKIMRLVQLASRAI